jgi:hypothetical protein
VTRGTALRWAARRLPAVDDQLRGDLVASADQLAARRGRVDRALETASLVGFALRSAARRGAHDDRRELLRQGARTGALLLALAGALAAWVAVAGGAGAPGPLSPPPVVDAGGPIALALAGLATLVATVIAGGLRAVAVVLAAVQAAAVAGAVAWTGAPGAALALPLLVLAAVAVGRRFDDRACTVGGLAAAAGVLAGASVAALAPAGAAGVLGVAALAVPAALLAVGWFDPRYAVSATVVWAWRLVAVDLGDLAAAVGDLADERAFRVLLARWLLMGAGVALAALVSSAAIRRSVSAFRSG